MARPGSVIQAPAEASVANGPLVAVDGLQLVELDYVDVGEVLQPANVVPVVVKSLAFGGSQQSHDRITVVR